MVTLNIHHYIAMMEGQFKIADELSDWEKFRLDVQHAVDYLMNPEGANGQGSTT